MIGSEVAAPAPALVGSSANFDRINIQLIVTLVLAALWLLPVVLMLSTSLKTQQQLYTPT